MFLKDIMLNVLLSCVYIFLIFYMTSENLTFKYRIETNVVKFLVPILNV